MRSTRDYHSGMCQVRMLTAKHKNRYAKPALLCATIPAPRCTCGTTNAAKGTTKQHAWTKLGSASLAMQQTMCQLLGRHHPRP
jgi:hypothetical protein